MEVTTQLGRRVLGAALLLALGATLAEAQSRPCGMRDKVLERLAEGYGESRQAVGLGANNGVVETFANPDTGTWTITITMPNGMTCLVASGRAYEALAEELVPTDESDA